MTKEEEDIKEAVLTIERLGLELVEHDHVWSMSLRNQYDKTLARLKKRLNGNGK
jgi:hypothetical protein